MTAGQETTTRKTGDMLACLGSPGGDPTGIALPPDGADGHPDRRGHPYSRLGRDHPGSVHCWPARAESAATNRLCETYVRPMHGSGPASPDVTARPADSIHQATAPSLRYT